MSFAPPSISRTLWRPLNGRLASSCRHVKSARLSASVDPGVDFARFPPFREGETEEKAKQNARFDLQDDHQGGALRRRKPDLDLSPADEYPARRIEDQWRRDDPESADSPT
ncbi:MAG: hypothetical protein HY859_07285 [Caulobacterales bacterium]|nr:hypothetical protein [Caulobacterales bacterium]